MNPALSLLTPPDPGSPAGAEPKFPAASARSRAAAPFSSVLERAEFRAPERPHQHARAAKANPQTTRAKAAREANAPADADRRPPGRPTPKSEKTSEDHSLAGACAVTGPAVKLDESVPTPETVAAAATEAAPLSSQPGRSATTNDGSAATLISPMTTGGEVASGAVLAAPAQPSPQTTEDLKSILAPAPAAATPTPTAAPPQAATEAATDVGMAAAPSAVESTPDAEALATATAAIAAAKSTTPAASAREAEVLMAATAETEAALNPDPAPASVSNAASALIAPDEARLTVRAARRFRTEALENAAGTGGAKSSETMKNVIKMEELAGAAQQILPGSSAPAVSALTNLPGEARRLMTSLNSSAEALQAAGKSSPAPVRADVASAGESLEVRATSPLARVSELISREVRMFKRGGDDLVEVVLTPDAKTQISLRLQWREGQVEVQARCDFGNYSSLNTEWSQLQNSLAQHGVRLSHLSERTTTGFTEFFSNPNFTQHQGRDRHSDAPAGRPESFSPVATPAVKPGGTAPAPRRNRLFDSWA
jgi:hypothetical protein